MASRCPLCGKAEENLDHLLVHCTLVWDLWADLISIPGLPWVFPYSFKDLLSSWTGFPIRKRARKLWMAGPLSLIWAIWKERNEVVFEDAVFSLSRLKTSFVSALISWVGLIVNGERSFVHSLRAGFRVVGVVCCPLYCIGLVFPCILRVYLGVAL